MRTTAESNKIVLSLVPAVRTSTTSSETVVDTLGYDNALWIIAVGDLDLASGDETYTCAVYESANADGSSASAITGASVTMTADNTVKKILVTGLGSGSRKRYQFVRFTLAGTTPSMPGTSICELCLGHYAPQQAPDATV